MSRSSAHSNVANDQEREATEPLVAPTQVGPEETFRAMPGGFGNLGDTVTVQHPTPRRLYPRPTRMEDVTGHSSQDSLAHLGRRASPEAQNVPLPPEDEREVEGDGILHRQLSQSPLNPSSEGDTREVENITRILEKQGALLNLPTDQAPIMSFTPTGAMTMGGSGCEHKPPLNQEKRH